MKNIWCIVPFSRPQNLNWVIDGFKSQTYTDKKLIIVENGPAVGACKKAGIQPDVLLTSKKHQSYAKNEALLWLKKNHPKDWWATWDDDDYYGPQYLQELADNTSKADIIGKASSFMKLTDDRLYMLTRWNQGEAEQPFIHGPTVTGIAGDSILFDYMDWGEDLVWVREMHRLGAKVYRTSQFHWCYFRFANTRHTWLISDDELRYSNTGQIYLASDKFDPDIVNGIVPVTSTPLNNEGFDIANSYSIRLIKEQTGDMVRSAQLKAANIMKSWDDSWPKLDLLDIRPDLEKING